MKPNHEKSKIAGIGALKNVKVVVCGMNITDFCNDAIKITGIYFFVIRKNGMKKKKSQERSVTKIQDVLKCGECAVLHLMVKL